MRGADGFNVQGCRLTTSPVLKSWRQAAPEHIRQSQEEHGGEHVSTTFAFFPIRDGDSHTFATVYGAALAFFGARGGISPSAGCTWGSAQAFLASTNFNCVVAPFAALGFRCAVVFTALAAALVAFLRPWHFLMFEAGWWRCSCSPLVTSPQLLLNALLMLITTPSINAVIRISL